MKIEVKTTISSRHVDAIRVVARELGTLDAIKLVRDLYPSYLLREAQRVVREIERGESNDY